MRWFRLSLLLTLGLFALPANGDELRESIDREVKAGWEKQKFQPAARTTDAQFLRRIYLDLVGTIPTHEEAVAFLDDPSPEKRTLLIEKLLAERKRQLGDAFDLQRFMDDFNAAGLVPAALLRWELTGRLPDDVRRMLSP